MYNNQKILAIIPARKGSKRLPNKNRLILHGKPLIAWTFDAAKKSKYIDTIVLSSDDDHLINLGRKYKIDAPFKRPEELAEDNSTTIAVILHSIEFYHSVGQDFDYILLLQPTSPLRSVEDIDNAIELLNEDVKSIVSVCETEHSPLWSNILPDNFSMKDFIPPKLKNIRTQDLPKYYRLNGAVYISEINYLKKNCSFLGENTKAYIMPQDRSIDIDTKLDFDLCNVLLNKESC